MANVDSQFVCKKNTHAVNLNTPVFELHWNGGYVWCTYGAILTKQTWIIYHCKFNTIHLKLSTVKPQPPTGVTIDRGQIKTTSVKITWTPGNDGGETQWFHVNHRKVATSVEFDPDKRSKRIDGAFEYLLERLSPFSLYEIEVYAVNVNGVSRSVKRNVTTLRKFLCFGKLCRSFIQNVEIGLHDRAFTKYI